MTVSATQDARQAATAASAALPPSARISAPAAAVAGCPAATAASIKLAPAPSGPRRSRDAFGEPAAEAPEPFEREVEPLPNMVAFGDLERALADCSRGELAVLELQGEPVDRKRDLVPPVAVRVRAGQLLAHFVRQLHRLRDAALGAEKAL